MSCTHANLEVFVTSHPAYPKTGPFASIITCERAACIRDAASEVFAATMIAPVAKRAPHSDDPDDWLPVAEFLDRAD